LRTVGKHCFASRHPIDQPVQNTICVDEICASCKFTLNERRRQRNRIGDNLLEDLKLEDGASFRNFGRITNIAFEAAINDMLQNIKLQCIVAWPYFEHLPRRYLTID
jgi:hypothetical protein